MTKEDIENFWNLIWSNNLESKKLGIEIYCNSEEITQDELFSFECLNYWEPIFWGRFKKEARIIALYYETGCKYQWYNEMREFVIERLPEHLKAITNPRTQYSSNFEYINEYLEFWWEYHKEYVQFSPFKDAHTRLFRYVYDRPETLLRVCRLYNWKTDEEIVEFIDETRFHKHHRINGYIDWIDNVELKVRLISTIYKKEDKVGQDSVIIPSNLAELIKNYMKEDEETNFEFAYLVCNNRCSFKKGYSIYQSYTKVLNEWYHIIRYKKGWRKAYESRRKGVIEEKSHKSHCRPLLICRRLKKKLK